MAKILLIDDDVALTRMMGDWLTFEQHQIKAVHFGMEGYREIQTEEYALVVLDWDLPDVAGIEVLKKYRDAGGTVPIIMLTGHGSIDDRVKGLDVGATDYLTKPFHMKELSARIRAVFKNVDAATPPPPKALGTGNEEILEIGNLAGTDLAARYEFLEVIGQGGVGVVFKAKNPHMDKFVAVKMLQSTQLNEEQVRKFKQEARAVSRLDHPNIINIFDFGITEKRNPYMVTEFIDGQALDAILHEVDFYPLRQGLELMHEVVDGLTHAHSQAILHSDIKPGNIVLKQVLDKQPVPKILDFGLAKLMENTPQQAMDLAPETKSIGSPPYMSPEQIRGETLDERSDVYQIGCVIFETVTGYAPFVGRTAQETILKHLQEEPYTFEEVRPDVGYPLEFRKLIHTALQRNPDDRYQTMQELKDDLEKVLQKLRFIEGLK